MPVLKALLATPFMWVWYIFLAALISLRGARKNSQLRVGWYILVFGLTLFTVLSFTPISDALTQPLLHRYSAPSAETFAQIEAITVLGGGGSNGEPSSVTYRRVREGIRLFKASNAKFFVVQGASQVPEEPTDAEIMKKIALENGIAIEKIFIDSNSRTTAEHPSQLEKLLPPDVGQIGIVTSAIHMPRAIQVFQKYFPDKTIVPLPVGISGWPSYRPANMVPSIDAFSKSTAALHEWVGLVWYAVRY